MGARRGARLASVQKSILAYLSSTPATSSASATSTTSGLITPTTGRNQRCAMKVGMSADPMTTVTRIVYWLWVMMWALCPGDLSRAQLPVEDKERHSQCPQER